MAKQKIARKDSTYRVISIVPDFCFVPGVTPPVPFPVTADLGSAVSVVKNVRINGKPAFVFDQSKAPRTIGDQAGRNKGVTSRTVGKHTWPKDHSKSVKIGQKKIVRTGDLFWMNGTFDKKGKANYKECKPCKAAALEANPINPILGIKVLPAETDFYFNGLMPVMWSRSYYSDQEGTGWLGQGWSVSISIHLERQDKIFRYIDVQGRSFALPDMEEDEEPVLYESEQIWFSRGENGRYLISNLDGSRVLCFAPIDVTAQDPQGENSHLYVLVGIFDQHDNFQRIIYDSRSGLPQALIDTAGRYFQFEFNNVADAGLDPIQRLVQITWLPQVPVYDSAPVKGEQLVTYQYDNQGDLIAVYDATGAVQRRFAYSNHLLVKHENASGLVAEYEYDEESLNGKVIRHWTNADGEWRFNYEEQHTEVIDPIGRVTHYYFDDNDEITKYVMADGNSIITERDHLGRALSVTDPLGRITRYQYNVEGQLIKLINPLGEIQHIDYDDQHRPIRFSNDQGQRTSYKYDELGNLESITNAKSEVTYYDYDQYGQLISITDAEGGEKSFEYNGLHQLVLAKDCSDKITQYRYDDKGRLIQLIDALEQVTYYTYDQQGNLTHIRHRDGSQERFTYDEAKRLIAYTDANGDKTELTYGIDDLPQKRINAVGDQFAYEYDQAKRVIALLNENQDRYRFTYDERDNLIQEIAFDGKAATYHYNAAQELLQENQYGQIDKPDYNLSLLTPLQIATHQRDGLGRVIERNIHQGDLTHTLRYEYDKRGNLIYARNKDSVIELAYDDLGRIYCESVWAVNGLETEYAQLNPEEAQKKQYFYDLLGNRSTLMLPDKKQLSHLYYGSGHLHGILLDREVICDIERDDLHREILRTQGKLSSVYDLDPVGRLKRQIAATALEITALQQSDKQSVLVGGAVKRSYQYDPVGNLTNTIDQRQGSIDYAYDAIGRILKAGEETFAFDPAHNLLDDQAPAQTAIEKAQTSTTKAIKDKAYFDQKMQDKTWSPLDERDDEDSINLNANRILEYQGTNYTYDAFGNLRKRIDADKSLFLDYDAANQLIKATIERPNQPAEVWHYVYDAFGRRMSKQQEAQPETLRLFTWDSARLIQEETTQHKYTYIYRDQGSFEPLAQVVEELDREESHILYYHTDQVGIPKEVTDAEGNLAWYGHYKAWGQLKEEHNILNIHQPFRLQNQYFDAETGLHYNLMRYYDSHYGRFINQDPIKLNGSINFYLFAANTSRWIDPLGLDVRVDRVGNNITYTVDISLNGDSVTDAHVQTVKNGIENTWNAQEWKYLGCNIKFAANVASNDSSKANQIKAPNTDGRSYVMGVGGNTGEWFMDDNNLGWTVAHEAGHLMGLDDRYSDNKDGISVAHDGWGDNIMGAANKPVQQKNIDELIGLKNKCICFLKQYF